MISRRLKGAAIAACGLLLLLVAAPALAAPDVSLGLDTGYRDMYNLDFAGAHQTFQGWEQAHPEDPLGPVSNAAAYLFAEFDRLHILELELFTDDGKLAHRGKSVPDPAVKAAFDSELHKADAMASQALARDPHDPNALFAQILANGLRGDYTALIEKRNLAGLSYMKTSRALAERLVSFDPSYYDAYLAIGVENYLLGVNPAPVRWLLRIGGAQTDKSQGLANLRLTAERGRYLAPYARLLLAVAGLRDKDKNTARAILAQLAREFPQNRLYRKELDRLQN